MAYISGTPNKSMEVAHYIEKLNNEGTQAAKRISESNQMAALQRAKFKVAETHTNTASQDAAKGASNLQQIS
ncbi:MAG: hypothetical protein WED00_13590 [Aquisalimonadaceae bacterium]